MIRSRKGEYEIVTAVLVVTVIALVVIGILLIAPNIKFEPTHVKCPKCGWEGNRNETIEDTDLIPVVHSTGKTTYITYIYDTDYMCPKCGKEVVSAKGAWPPVNETAETFLYS